jgi:hypothetical protein
LLFGSLKAGLLINATHIRDADIVRADAKMNASRLSWAIVFFLVIVLARSPSIALATRCQIGNVSYMVPQQAVPSQRIETATTVNGSCESNGEDYYSIRVDLIDVPSSMIVSSNSTPIGYNATNFTITVENMVTTPANNGTWHILLNVYVIRAGGTSGSYLLDYRTTDNATIQIGGATPVPEYPGAPMLAVALIIVAVTLQRRRTRKASAKCVHGS